MSSEILKERNAKLLDAIPFYKKALSENNFGVALKTADRIMTEYKYTPITDKPGYYLKYTGDIVEASVQKKDHEELINFINYRKKQFFRKETEKPVVSASTAEVSKFKNKSDSTTVNSSANLAKPVSSVPAAKTTNKKPVHTPPVFGTANPTASAKPESRVPTARPDSRVASTKSESRVPTARPDSRVPSARPESHVPTSRPDSRIPSARPESRVPAANPEGRDHIIEQEIPVVSSRPESRLLEPNPEIAASVAKPESRVPEPVNKVKFEDQEKKASPEPEPVVSDHPLFEDDDDDVTHDNDKISTPEVEEQIKAYTNDDTLFSDEDDDDYSRKQFIPLVSPNHSPEIKRRDQDSSYEEEEEENNENQEIVHRTYKSLTYPIRKESSKCFQGLEKEATIHLTDPFTKCTYLVMTYLNENNRKDKVRVYQKYDAATEQWTSKQYQRWIESIN